MPIYYEETLKNDIKTNNTAPCYIIFGEDAYLKKYYTDSLTKLSFDGDAFFNLQKFENDINFQLLFDAVTQYPMMADKKCVVVSDFDFEHAFKTELDDFINVIANVGEGCTLIIRFDGVEFDAKKSNKAKKLISACEDIGGKAVCLDHRTPQMLTKMTINAVSKRGCKISEKSAKYLLENVGDDIYVIQSEIDKLCSFVGKNEIDNSVIDFLCVKTVEVSVYDYTKKIFACDVSGALSLLDDMFYKRIEPAIILHTVASNYVDIYRVFAGKKTGVNNTTLAKDFAYGNKAFLLDKAAQHTKKFDNKIFNLSFKALMWADDSLKSNTNSPQTVLEQLTVKLIYIISKGESLD